MFVIKLKSISFTEDFFAEYEYLKAKPNASRYVCELIRDDMSAIDKKTRVIIQELLRGETDAGPEVLSVIQALLEQPKKKNAPRQ